MIFRLLFIALLAWQSDVVQTRFEPSLNQTSWQVSATGLDRDERKRRVTVTATFPGRQYNGHFGVAVAIELLRPPQQASFDAPVSLTINDVQAYQASKRVLVMRLDAESQKLATVIPASALLGFAEAKTATLSLDGIAVTLDEDGLKPIKELVRQLKQ